MAKSNMAVAFAGQFQAVVTGLSSRLDKRGVRIVDAISQLAQSGSEAALDKISDILAAIACVFRVPVNYADARWSTLAESYTYTNPDLKIEHFPINGTGQGNVVMEYVTFDHEPTTQEVLDEIERRGNLRRPDRAETESFIDAHPEEKDKYPIIGLCGSIVKLDGDRYVADVDAYESRRSLYFLRLAYQWRRDCRFLAVRK